MLLLEAPSPRFQKRPGGRTRRPRGPAEQTAAIAAAAAAVETARTAGRYRQTGRKKTPSSLVSSPLGTWTVLGRGVVSTIRTGGRWGGRDTYLHASASRAREAWAGTRAPKQSGHKNAEVRWMAVNRSFGWPAQLRHPRMSLSLPASPGRRSRGISRPPLRTGDLVRLCGGCLGLLSSISGPFF